MKRGQIGRVTVDSGRLIILDPCYVDQRRLGMENYRAVCRAADRPSRPYAEIIIAAMGSSVVVSATPPDTNSFSVFAAIEDVGEIARIVIDLTPGSSGN